MRIIQTLTEQHTKTTLRTILSPMSHEVADKTSTPTEEEVSVVIIQTRESIKCEAVNVDGGRKQRMLIKADPMDVMVIQHGLLNYSIPIQRPSLLYGWNGYRSITTRNISKRQDPGDGRTNVGSTNTIGGDMERPGIGSNHTQAIRSLHNPS
jgi:hypothetical protein